MDDNGVCVNFCCVDIEKKTRCLFCEEAPCTKACGKGNPARAIRAIRFDNSKNAGKWLEGCSDADLERAEQACIHYDRPIRIRELLKAVECEPVENNKPLPSLAITFCGIPCENPFFLASSAVCSNYDMVARALEMGWAGVFYKTICKQDIHEVSPRFDAVKEGTAFAGFRNMEQLSENPYEVDFDILRRLKQNYPTKVIVASLCHPTAEKRKHRVQRHRRHRDLARCAGIYAARLSPVPVGLPVGRYRAGEKDWKIETFTALPCRTPKYRCGRCGR